MFLEETVKLKEYEDFVKILDGRRVYYGGDQEWFEDKVYRRVGCATVSAANIMAYLSNKIEYSSLNKHKGFSKFDFINHMNELAKYIVPDPSIGIISALYFIEKVESFSKSRLISLNSKWISNVESFENICTFIKEALNKDMPIAMLMYKNEKLKDYDWHWMTITKYYRNNEHTYVKVSTWGECKIIRLEEFYKYSAYGALVYFT